MIAALRKLRNTLPRASLITIYIIITYKTSSRLWRYNLRSSLQQFLSSKNGINIIQSIISDNSRRVGKCKGKTASRNKDLNLSNKKLLLFFKLVKIKLKAVFSIIPSPYTRRYIMPHSKHFFNLGQNMSFSKISSFLRL